MRVPRGRPLLAVVFVPQSRETSGDPFRQALPRPQVQVTHGIDMETRMDLIRAYRRLRGLTR